MEIARERILVIDDEAHQRQLMKMVLEPEGFEVDEAEDGDIAIEMAKSKNYSLVLLDLKMKRMGGIETLEALKKLSPHIVVIIMTAFASVETAVKAMKLGALDYLAKPLDIDELKQVVAKAIGHTITSPPEEDFKHQIYDELGYEGVIGSSKIMHSVFKDVLRVAKTDATVMIYGESGTGKELIARAIHKGSGRKGKFVTVNCGALTETLLESELFGIEKGVATGVVEREGKFSQADGGTIFLDEVADMSPKLQTKVLRVLQEKEFEKVGSTKIIKVDVRVIAASNKDLLKEMKAGNFREDLYYRLNVVPIFLPPLRERKEDIPELVQFFIKKYGEKNKKSIRGISPEAMELLSAYDWPGNIRQLENAIERAVIMTLHERIESDDLPSYLKEPPERKEKDVSLVIKDVERELIKRALTEAKGNKTQAAKLLGISRRTLFYKIKEYGIE